MTLQEYLDGYEAAHKSHGNQVTHAIGIPMIAYWQPFWGIGLFIAGWVFQFIGHYLEGNSPKFFQGPMYLLVGPMWIVIKLGRWLHVLPQKPTS